MKVTKKDLKQSQVELTIEISNDVLDQNRKKAIKQAGEQVEIQGFRKGHAPEEAILEKVGPVAIEQEAHRLTITSNFHKALEQENVMPVSQPKIDITSAEPFTFVATFSVAPSIDLGKYKDVKVSVKETKVSKKEIDEVMKQLQEQVPSFTEVTRAAKEGDQAVVDFEGFTLDGEPVANTKVENHPLVIGSNQLIPGFEEEVVGMKAGDEKNFEITFPADYHAKEMAGQKYKFHIKLNKVEEKSTPEVNEEFVEKITGKKDTVASLEAEIEKNLKMKQFQENRAKAEEELLDKLASTAKKFDVPQSMIEEETAFLVDNVKMGGLQQGMPWEKYLEAMGKTEEDIKKEVAKDAEKRVRYRLIMQEIIKVEAIEADKTKLEARVAHMFSHLPDDKKQAQSADYKEGGRVYEQHRNMMLVESVFGMFLGTVERDAHGNIKMDGEKGCE